MGTKNTIKSNVTRNLEYIFLTITFILLLSFLTTQFIWQDAYSYRHPEITYLDTDVYYEKEDKTLVKLVAADSYFSCSEAKAGQDNTLIFTLPEINSDDLNIAFFTSDNDVRIFIDGKLRTQYCDEKYRIFGTYSTAKYITVPLKKSDSGKQMKIICNTTLESSASTWNVPVMGTEKSIIFWILYRSSWQIISAIILLAVGIIFIAFGVIVKFGGKYNRGICYLGLFSIIMALWLLCQSEMRAFYFTYMSATNLMTSFTLMLAPIPMLFFFNELFKNEYHRMYDIAAAIAIINVCISLVIECTGAADIVECLMPTHLIILGTCGLCLVTFLKYAKKSEIASPWAVAIGMSGLIATTLVEDINKAFYHSFFVGKYVGYGILIFLLSLGYSALKGMVIQERKFQDAVKANSVKTAFLANMSHEIRTPINTIMGMNEMILRENEDKDIAHYARNIKDSSKILLSIVNDILDFTKLESGKMEIVPRRYDFADLLNDLINAINLRAEEKNLALELDIEEIIPSVLFGDELRIKQAITNILINAVKYTSKGTITIRIQSLKISQDEIRLFVSVRDTGIGIRKEDIDKLFDSFVRLETNKNRSIEGAGLGMAITKHIIDGMNGELNVESTYGKGSTFSVSFIQKVLDETPIGSFEKWYRVGDEVPKPYVEQYQASDVCILVVDDNEMNLEVIKGLLKKTDIKIDCALSGAQCLQMVSQKEYDLIFLDHMMPEMDGVETLKKLQEGVPKGKYLIPVVALTANAISGSREEYMRYGFSDYIAKPVEYRKLIAVLRKFLPDKMEKRADIRGMEEACTEYLENNGIHMSEAIKYAGDDLAQYIHLLGLFASERSKEKKVAVYEAFIRQNWKEYTVYVHGLKNSARTIGADKLADLAYNHEIKAKEADSTFLCEHYEELVREWDNVVKIIKDFMAQQDKDKIKSQSSISVQQPLSEKQYMQGIQTVIDYLDTFKKKEAVKVLEELLEHEIVSDRKDKLKLIKQAVQSYDYEKAIEMLRNELKDMETFRSR